MGKVRDFGFKPEHSQLLSARAHTAPAAAKVQPAVAVPAPKLERLAQPSAAGAQILADPDLKPRKAAASSAKPVGNGSARPVGNAGQKDATAAARQAKWRAQHPEQHRDQMRVLRAKKKAGKAVGS